MIAEIFDAIEISTLLKSIQDFPKVLSDWKSKPYLGRMFLHFSQNKARTAKTKRQAHGRKLALAHFMMCNSKLNPPMKVPRSQWCMIAVIALRSWWFFQAQGNALRDKAWKSPNSFGLDRSRQNMISVYVVFASLLCFACVKCFTLFQIEGWWICGPWYVSEFMVNPTSTLAVHRISLENETF